MADQAPDAAMVRRQLGAVVELLTLMSLESTAALVEGDLHADDVLDDYNGKLENLSAMITLKEDDMNPRWNKVYGKGGTDWQGPLQDGRDRGGVDYFCPRGWARFSLDVCADADFEERFKGWGYLYHGTNSKHVGSILASGLRGSVGLCFCGKDEQAVYMSPSLEYSGHPRYASIEYNPETKKFLQIVLQCRVNPKAVWKKCKETLFCEDYGVIIDPNIPNNNMEWLFRPNSVDPSTGLSYIKDAIVCTGIMVRMTDKHPLDLSHWWARDKAYAARCGVQFPRVEPLPVQLESIQEWEIITNCTIDWFTDFKGCCWDDSFHPSKPWTVHLRGPCRLSPLPFAKGTMRLAYLLEAPELEEIGWSKVVVKEYNWHTRNHIEEALHISMEEALMKDVRTYLAVRDCVRRFRDYFPKRNFDMDSMVPCIVRLQDSKGQTRLMFGETYVHGDFIKWNNNNGGVNMVQAATTLRIHELASVFAHFTHHISGGELMAVDLQGWSGRVDGRVRLLLTDPQIHTRSFSGSAKERSENLLYRRFSLGNMGRTGMVRFFRTHKCHPWCQGFKTLRRAAIGRQSSRLIEHEMLPKLRC